MKKAIFAASLSLFAATSFAQSAKQSTSQEAAQARVEKMGKSLNLNVHQKRQIVELEMSLGRRTQLVMNESEDDKQRTQALNEISNYRIKAYRGILTDDQYKKWSAPEAKK